MNLKKLLKDIQGIELKGAKDIEISGVCSDSKYVSPGNLFVAKRGNSHDGNQFISQAIRSGAKAILTDLFDPAYKEIAQIVCKDVKRVEAAIAATFYARPADQLYVVGITGTSGKTSVSYYVKHLLEKLDGSCGLIGTIGYQIGDCHYPSTHTTPDVSRVHKLLREMVDAKQKSAVMEVTSHALDQERVSEVSFDTAVFTNLSPEHLDYHDGMEAYAKAKEKLFYMLEKNGGEKGAAKTAIVNADSPWSQTMLERYRGATLTYGIENHADVRAVGIENEWGKTHMTTVFRGMNCPATLPFSGKIFIYNYLAAIAVGLSRGFSLESCVASLSAPPKIPGRLESVENSAGIFVFIDYAHKPDALESVLKSLMEIKKRRVITVFGCGGDRDPYKRPMMAAAAEKYSDRVIVTTDNPRSESPLAIIDSIIKGFANPCNHTVEPDRKKAIGLAVSEAVKDDIILVAGKGHENYQIFAHQTLPFDDARVAKEFLDQKTGQICH